MPFRVETNPIPDFTRHLPRRCLSFRLEAKVKVVSGNSGDSRDNSNVSEKKRCKSSPAKSSRTVHSERDAPFPRDMQAIGPVHSPNVVREATTSREFAIQAGSLVL